MSSDPAVPNPKNSLKWLWVVGLVGALVVFGVIATGGGADTTPAAAPSVSTPPPKPGLEVPPSAPAVPPTPVHIVVFEVTGAGTGTATYSTDGAGGATAATEVPLPWSTTLELPVDPGRQAISLVAEAGPGTPEVSAKITVDGLVVREGKSGGTFLSVSLNATV
jgi:hypothetical protein